VPFVLNGIGPGRAFISASQCAWRAVENVRPEIGKVMEVRTPTDRPIEIPLTVVSLQEVDLHISVPRQERPFRGEAWFRPEEGGEIVHVELRSLGSKEGEFQRLRLAAGRYEVLLHSNSLSEMSRPAGTPGGELENFFFHGFAEVPGAGALFLEMSPGASLEGHAERDGKPLSDDVVFLKLDGWKHAPYRSKTDATGWFRFSGLVPGREYRFENGLVVRAGPSGSSTSILIEDPNGDRR
jgi:hypothetical protein